MTLNIPPESEHLFAAAVAQGHFSTPADALRRAIDLLAAEQGVALPTSNGTQSNWAQSFRQWAEDHPSSDHEVHTDRESIYGSRGL